jgi:ribonucleoside-diphosphate reductase alpha chain
VKPSTYLHDYIFKNIREPYVLEQVTPIFKSYLDNNIATAAAAAAAGNTKFNNKLEPTDFETNPISIRSSDPYVNSMPENNKELCPSCKNFLIITEGCNMCIECGFSSCASG